MLLWAPISAGLAQGKSSTGHAEAKESRPAPVAPAYELPLRKTSCKALASNQRENRPAFWSQLLKTKRQYQIPRQLVDMYLAAFPSGGTNPRRDRSM